MRYEAASRIMSLSFERDPEEHADVILQSGRRFMTSQGPRSAWPVLFGAIGFGVVLGLVMELYRRYLLPELLDQTIIPPLNIIVLQLLPFILLLIGLYYGLAWYLARQRRQALIGRLEPRLFVDTDIFPDGLSSTSGLVTIELDWHAIRQVLIGPKRIEFEGESYVIYLPERAFADHATFNVTAKKIRKLWQKAKRAEREAARDRSDAEVVD